MKKNLLCLLIISMFFLINSVSANTEENHALKHNSKQQEIDNMLYKRLNLSEKQKENLANNRKQYKEEMQKTIKRMEYVKNEIKKIYQSNISKTEANIKSAPLKIELVMLKQKAQNIRKKSKRNFEKNLNSVQKAEFEKIKHEFHCKKNINSQRRRINPS